MDPHHQHVLPDEHGTHLLQHARPVLHGACCGGVCNPLPTLLVGPDARLLGAFNFLGLYIGGGLVAGICSLAYQTFNTNKSRRIGGSEGASGAIYACLAFYGTIFPQATFLLFFIIPARAWMVVGGLFAVSVLAASSASCHVPRVASGKNKPPASHMALLLTSSGTSGRLSPPARDLRTRRATLVASRSVSRPRSMLATSTLARGAAASACSQILHLHNALFSSVTDLPDGCTSAVVSGGLRRPGVNAPRHGRHPLRPIPPDLAQLAV